MLYTFHTIIVRIFMSSTVIRETVFSVENNFTGGDNIIASRYRQQILIA